MASTLTAPTPITIPFAASGSKNTIPTTSQIGVVDGAASYPDGFPPLCGTPLESGGKPPSRADMNGILHGITENLRYLLGGCVPKFNATLAAAIGGYPLGAILQDNTGTNCYRNLVDGNSTNFNTDASSIGVSWELVYGPGKTSTSATTSVSGVVELATTAETVAGTDYVRAVTPAGLAGFSKNLSSNGYAKLPGGLILQWGSFNDYSYTAGNKTLPITFPTEFFGVLASNNSRQGGFVDNAFAYPVSLSQFYLATKTSNGDSLSGFGVTWFAIGY